MARKPIPLEQAVALVALNDEPTVLSAKEMVGYASTMLLAEIYGLTSLGAARKVVAWRRAHPEEF